MDKKHDDKKTGPVIPDRLLIFLLIFMGCLLIVPGCISQPVAENRTGDTNVSITSLPATTTIAIEISTYREFEESLQTLMGYKDNMTPAQQKIPTQLLELIDINFPVSDKERQNVKTTMIVRNQLIPADKAKLKFNINQSANLPVGDQVYIYIYINKSASIHIVDPFVTEVTGSDEKYHFAVAWIDIKNVEKLATLQEVRSIMVVQPAKTDSYYIPISTDNISQPSR